MSNRPQEPDQSVTESQRRSRERFTFGVFAVLATLALVLVAMLLYKLGPASRVTSGEPLTGAELTNSHLQTNDP